MSDRSQNKVENLVSLIFLILGFLGIIYFKDFKMALFVANFLIVFAISAYLIVDCYISIRDRKNHFSWIKIIGFAIFAPTLLFIYGGDSFLRAVLFSFVLSFTIIIMKSFIQNK